MHPTTALSAATSTTRRRAARKRCVAIQKLAADKHIVAFGFCGHPKVDGHLRKAGQEPSSPVVFPVDDNEGFTNGDDYARDFPSAKKLLAKASLALPKK